MCIAVYFYKLCSILARARMSLNTNEQVKIYSHFNFCILRYTLQKLITVSLLYLRVPCSTHYFLGVLSKNRHFPAQTLTNKGWLLKTNFAMPNLHKSNIIQLFFYRFTTSSTVQVVKLKNWKKAVYMQLYHIIISVVVIQWNCISL